MLSCLDNTKPAPWPPLTVDQFIKVSRAKAKEMFLSAGLYKRAKLATFDGLLVIDPELPEAQQRWGMQSDDFLRAWKTRLEVVRECCPKALITAHGLVYAPYEANVKSLAGDPYAAGKTWLTGQWVGYQRAAKMFGSLLDYGCAVAPALWGPKDSKARQATVIPAVQVAIEYTRKLLPTLPMSLVLRFEYGELSKNKGEPISTAILHAQIRAAIATGMVSDILFWSAPGDVTPATLAEVGKVSPLGLRG